MDAATRTQANVFIVIWRCGRQRPRPPIFPCNTLARHIGTGIPSLLQWRHAARGCSRKRNIEFSSACSATWAACHGASPAAKGDIRLTNINDRKSASERQKVGTSAVATRGCCESALCSSAKRSPKYICIWSRIAAPVNAAPAAWRSPPGLETAWISTMPLGGCGSSQPPRPSATPRASAGRTKDSARKVTYQLLVAVSVGDGGAWLHAPGWRHRHARSRRYGGQPPHITLMEGMTWPALDQKMPGSGCAQRNSSSVQKRPA